MMYPLDSSRDQLVVSTFNTPYRILYYPSRVDCQPSPGLNLSRSPTGPRWPCVRPTVVAPVGCTPTPMSTPYVTLTVGVVATSSRWRATSTRTSTTGGSSRILTGKQDLGFFLCCFYSLDYIPDNVKPLNQGSYAAWKSLNSMEFHLLKIKALKAWNLIN